MDPIILNDIPVQVEEEKILEKLGVKEKPRFAEAISQMIGEARVIGRPKAMYKPAFVDSKGEDYVVIEGIKFTSRVLRVNLDSVYRVFPYVVTCGLELADWASSFKNVLECFWADTITEAVLRSAIKYFENHLKEHFNPGPTAKMNPGSLEDWPINEQKKLFALLGDPREAIGVELTESFLMVPLKSVSGILFPTKVKYENCQLCPRKDCPERKAAYKEELLKIRYGIFKSSDPPRTP